MRRFLLVGLMVFALSGVEAHAKAPRSAGAKREFVRAYPCPATGVRSTSCAGYVIDHVVPLCAGGLDVAANMQWQAIKSAKAKDREEAALCRKMKRGTEAPRVMPSP